MADVSYSFPGVTIAPVAGMVKPPPTMSLSDIVNTARGTQLLQKEAIDLRLAQTQEAERQNIERFLSDPANFQTDGRVDVNKLNAEIPKIAPVTGGDWMRKYTDLSTAQTQADVATQNLTQDQRRMIAGRLSILGRMGVKDPAQYASELDLLIKENPNNRSLASLADAYKKTLGLLPQNADLPSIAVQASQKLMTPTEQETVFGPKVEVTAGGQTVTRQTMPGTQPTRAEVGIVGGIQPPVTGPAAPAAEPRNLPYPVRSATQPFIPEPGEVADREAGQAYRTKIVDRQTNLAINRRNVEEVIKQAKDISGGLYFEKGGIPGAVERRIRMAISSDQYDLLAKDLANMALSNSQALGSVGNTVAGLDMQAVANGTIKVPPDVLVQIARRVQADQTNLDMQANGAQKFAERFGDNNMKRFQQNWNANADTKIFEVMNIYRDETDPAKRKDLVDKLLGTDPKKRQEFFNKYNNLKKLSETGSL